MNESDLLWTACLAAPADDTARQVFADKLQEAGFERMADLMRGSQGRAWVHIAAGVPMANRLLELQFMSQEEREEELTTLINDGINEIFHDGLAADEIAGTNAAAWGVDPDIDIQTVRFDPEGCHVHFAFHASGEQNEDAEKVEDECAGRGVPVADVDRGGVEDEPRQRERVVVPAVEPRVDDGRRSRGFVWHETDAAQRGFLLPQATAHCVGPKAHAPKAIQRQLYSNCNIPIA